MRTKAHTPEARAKAVATTKARREAAAFAKAEKARVKEDEANDPHTAALNAFIRKDKKRKARGKRTSQTIPLSAIPDERKPHRRKKPATNGAAGATMTREQVILAVMKLLLQL